MHTICQSCRPRKECNSNWPTSKYTCFAVVVIIVCLKICIAIQKLNTNVETKKTTTNTIYILCMICIMYDYTT